jgi:hypothetical protein
MPSPNGWEQRDWDRDAHVHNDATPAREPVGQVANFPSTSQDVSTPSNDVLNTTNPSFPIPLSLRQSNPARTSMLKLAREVRVMFPSAAPHRLRVPQLARLQQAPAILSACPRQQVPLQHLPSLINIRPANYEEVAEVATSRAPIPNSQHKKIALLRWLLETRGMIATRHAFLPCHPCLRCINRHPRPISTFSLSVHSL